MVPIFGFRSGKLPSAWSGCALFAAVWLCLEIGWSEWQIQQGETCTFDWDAYMEQVYRMQHGSTAALSIEQQTAMQHAPARWTFNYSELRGDTGPLVYPAMHTWIHSGLLLATGWDPVRWTTEFVPKNISGYATRTHRPAALLLVMQRWYLALHVLTLLTVFATYCKTGLVVSACAWVHQSKASGS